MGEVMIQLSLFPSTSLSSAGSLMRVIQATTESASITVGALLHSDSWGPALPLNTSNFWSRGHWQRWCPRVLVYSLIFIHILSCAVHFSTYSSSIPFLWDTQFLVGLSHRFATIRETREVQFFVDIIPATFKSQFYLIQACKEASVTVDVAFKNTIYSSLTHVFLLIKSSRKN